MFNAQDYVDGQLMTHVESVEMASKHNQELFIEAQMQRPDIDQDQERKHSVKQSNVTFDRAVAVQRTETAEKDDEYVARMGHYIAIDHGVRNISSAQDFTSKGSGIDLDTGKSFKWCALFDGHGKNNTIDFIRSQLERWASCICEKDPMVALQQRLLDLNIVPYGMTSGTTALIAKIFQDQIQVFSVGDSEARVFRNGELIWKNEHHELTNNYEVLRLRKMYAYPSKPFEIKWTDNIKVLSADTIASCKSMKIILPSNDGRRSSDIHLALTQAIGHTGRFGTAPETFSCSIEEGANYRIVFMSDGVGDMMIPAEEMQLATMMCDEMLDLGEGRWKQTWKVVDIKDPEGGVKGNHQFTKKEEFDDVSAMVVDIKPWEV
jgi:serine/threonine protein phosphatase PrpC